MEKAKFSINTKKKIHERDWGRCIICSNLPTDIHHAYFWPIEANYSPTRNDIDQWVTLCRRCHNECHAVWVWNWKRQKCIDYLKKMYL